jgi:hypothetical protein
MKEFVGVQTGSVAHPATCSLGAGALSPGLKRSGVKLLTQLHLMPRLKNASSYTSTSRYIFMTWYLVKHRDSFTFAFTIRPSSGYEPGYVDLFDVGLPDVSGVRSTVVFRCVVVIPMKVYYFYVKIRDHVWNRNRVLLNTRRAIRSLKRPTLESRKNCCGIAHWVK